MTYVWRPPREIAESSNVKSFMDKVRASTYKELVKRSVSDVEWFWRNAEEELEVEWFRPYVRVLDVSKGVEWANWFIGGEINVVHNVLDRHAESRKRNGLAFIWVGEDGVVKHYSYWQLYRESNRFANFLLSLGVIKGDVVASYLPMLPETIVVMMASLKIGAVFSPIFSGLSAELVATRLADSRPKVVITADGQLRRGREIPLKPTIDEACRIANIKPIRIIVSRLGIDVDVNEEDVYYHEAVKRGSAKLNTTSMNPNDAALLLYTSGTTGKPKGAVISHVGALLQPAKEIFFNLDLKPGDVLMWITDIGWMMGPWQILGSQHLGATHLIFEGAIDYPDPGRVWGIIEEHRVTHVGFSATVVRSLRKHGDEWLKRFDLTSLRILGNTGETIDPASWMWLVKDVGEERCPIINLSGGTEIFGCFLLPSPVVELKPSTLWGPGLGMDVDVFDDSGRPIRGEVGYLVCRKPAPSMTRGFWGDPARYIETYWSRFPSVWYHGDWAVIDEDGFWFLLGRADDVIKVGGKRIGPAEIEAAINNHRAVAESACIGVPHEVRGEEVVCFVVLRQGIEHTDELREEIFRYALDRLGKVFAPSKLIVVRELPKTRSGKIMRRVVKAAVLGERLGDTSTLENPSAIEEVKEAWLRSFRDHFK